MAVNVLITEFSFAFVLIQSLVFDSSGCEDGVQKHRKLGS